MYSANILTACKKLGTEYKPICDYNAYLDGKCVIVQRGQSSFHFSQPSAARQYGFSHKFFKGAYIYTGDANSRYSLQHQAVGHTWSTTNDKDGDTVCVKDDLKKDSFTFNGYDFTRVRVSGAMTNANILTACSNNGLAPVCDYPGYHDGKCKLLNTQNW
jgi:hypothetical protein